MGREYFDTAGYSISYNDFRISLNLSRLLEESDHTPIFVVPYAVPPARESLTAEGMDLTRKAIVVCVIWEYTRITPPIFPWGGVPGPKEKHNVGEFVRDSEDLGRLAEHPESAGNRDLII